MVNPKKIKIGFDIEQKSHLRKQLSSGLDSELITALPQESIVKNHADYGNLLPPNITLSEKPISSPNDYIVSDSSNGSLKLGNLRTQQPRTSKSNPISRDNSNSTLYALPLVVPTLIRYRPPVVTVLPSLDLSQTFFLNSLPGANHTIYLDFDGHTTSGTQWNTSKNIANIITPSFDIDGNTASFSLAELERIQYIWQRVAEDFIPFNVNVTTQAPADINDLIKSDSNDKRWGVRVAIGGSNSDWLGTGDGGIAYIGSFNLNSDTPAFVFAKNTNNGNERDTAYVISHEVGHTLGLKHDGRIKPAEEYYAGHGSGPTGWAPIMGLGYSQELLQWSKGEYASANNTEDDLQIITTQNGFGYRNDDTGDTIATAKTLTSSGTSVSGSGIIERNTDVDFYRFSTSSGTINLTVNPFTSGPNLDIFAGLYNATGALITSSDLTDSLSASIATTVPTGTYYLKIDGVGKGDRLTTGYTDYGSLGQYSVSGTTFNNYVITIQRWATGQGGFWDTQKWLSGDFNGDGKVDLAKTFNDVGQASMDVHLSNGGSFGIGRWATRQGGFWDAQKWLTGDFNGDKKDDLVNIFNDVGQASIDVHLSNGGSFGIGRWATRQGGFWDTQQWLTGDFNGDGQDDLVNIINDAGLASMDVHLSNGGSFGIGRWATRQGEFWGTQKWLTGDFNGDGKDDLAKAFNDGGLASIDVYLSNGGGFASQRWATRQGGFWEAQKWLAGDFNGDGKDDLAKAFDDGGLASIDVHLSNGGGFGIERWATRQGGFWNTQQWLTGDFNGNGMDDFAKAFNDAGLASIDTHIFI
ncbi:hypothetical protein NIES2100_74370 [Calothrix sp. NIES-2100]|uniref:FG-GAP repeat domain-containing protein n=1 Tax=Calothrix sp. NIES-2100 TaxID=1954172 RepID=UPI000B6177C5|nr:hypothetical protein NIES2100_74370 [Calothrix sp. NIES-2100]